MLVGKMLLRGLGISAGAVLGSLTGVFFGEALFFLFFGMGLSSAEGTRYDIYAIIFTFNGALFGLFLGGLVGFILMRNLFSSHKSQSDIS